MLKEKKITYTDCLKALWTEKEIPSQLSTVRGSVWQSIAWFLLFSVIPLYISSTWKGGEEDAFETITLQFLCGILIGGGIYLLLPLLLKYAVTRGWLFEKQ